MFLVLILLGATLLRLFFLSVVPTSISGDELSYILNAKAFLLSGYDISGTMSLWQVFLFKYPPLSLPQAELPYFFVLPFVTGKFSLLAIRLPFAFMGVALVGLVYLVAKELLDRRVALLASFFAAISPWFLFINRTAYEMTPAMLFYLLGLYLLLKLKGWKIFWAFPIFLLAFYSYIATKLVFFPFIILTLLYLYFVKHKRHYGKQYAVFAGLSLVFLFFFVGLLFSQSGSRVSDILLPTSPIVSEQVDALRKVSIANPLNTFFINKLTVYATILSSHFFNTLSSSYLFVSGDSFFGMWRHGIFYLLDAVFILIGLFALVRKKLSVAFFLIASIFLGILPQIVHKGADNFTPHITFIFPFVLMIVAYGVVFVIDQMQRFKKIIWVVVIGTYLLLAGNFLQIYFAQYPLHGDSDFPVRVLSRYIELAENSGQKVVVYSQRSNDLLRKYIFYTSFSTKENQVTIRSELGKEEPQIANVIFRSCNEKVDPKDSQNIVILTNSCKNKTSEQPTVAITQLSDGGAVYNIYNDTICKKYELAKYPSGLQLNDFEVEALSEEQFCTKFITQPL